MKINSTLNDKELIQLFIDGNSAAFGIVVERHKTKIFTSIYMMVKDKYLAEDIFQDMCIRIINTLKNGNYVDNGKFLSWAMRIAHNMCVDHFRKVKHKPIIRTADGHNIFDVLNFSEPGVEEKIMNNESYSTIKKVVDMLPDEQREVIILRHFADQSFKEISELTNVSINTALGRMRYGLMNMRKLLVENQIAI